MTSPPSGPAPSSPTLLQPGGPGRTSSAASGPFEKTKGWIPNWLPFHPNPSRPRFRLPAGAVDAHCHVFGPGAQFPYAPERKYTPCDASAAQLFALRDFLGFDRNVIVQATCHGADNRALVDALVRSGGRARGVATVNGEVTDAELAALDAAGVRGVRFNFVRRLVDTVPREGELTRDCTRAIAPIGWARRHLFRGGGIAGALRLLRRVSLPTPVVVDHMGRPDVTQPVDGPEFERFLQLMRERTNIWSKVTCPERLSKSGPPGYDDVVPFARRVVELFPDRVLWGTDWPHPNLKGHMPDDGALVDFIPKIATSCVALQSASLLVDNPMRLYWGR